MSLLYVDEKDRELNIEVFWANDLVWIQFESNYGKHGTFEPIANYKLTPQRLLQILNDRDDYTDNELDP
jgi:hypothetical protein